MSRGADQGPEFEVGRILIDLNYEKLFGESLKIKASIKNLLDEEVSWERNDRVIETYKDGVSFSFGASYEF